MRKIFLLLAFLPFFADAGGACDKAITNADMLRCAEVEYSAADKNLNAIYSKLLKKLDAEGQRKLRASQRAWIKFRDLDSEFSGDINRGGSAESLTIIGAQTLMTEVRAKELEQELKIRE
ncbi:lysozyme inhibitor LprI family protein [Pseudogulbenkiania sp. MAI-1]|uniref:lysozyme inhibitor LprI family protein n=1 Tax=Pseudogulbenkiania sp. MAI-1 TaxID=990370 RepID=UPI0005606F75|nr:lysozyme inhibitor LprI family protein [Pseudogulbenkiania sp. MAI-1]